MYKIGIEDEFEAFHFLTGDFGPENQLHGHRYRVRVTLEGERLDESGMLYDFAKLQASLKKILSRLNYQTLNEIVGLREANPTVENLCLYIHQHITAMLHDESGGEQITGLEVTVWESTTSFASFRS
jgi:6-pyruvoyltetrahydropterin/6-carboxytetrahydropterin synthase